MKKIYMRPASLQFNMQTEQMIAASLGINEGEADQWTNEMDNGGWNSEDWSEVTDEESIVEE